jgi:HAE1 family hydrophobic/amphiphilic exporter-1
MDRKDLAGITIHGAEQTVRLSEIADIRESTSPREILRRNQSRIIRITAQMGKEEALDKMSGRIRASLASLDVPRDYRITITGEEAQRKASMQNLGFALLLSVVLVYMVLASQFESLVHPFTILLTIPLAGVGTVLLFWLLGRPLDIMALIGVILLAGIAVNDSIILVDRINQLRQEGLARRDAIVEAGRQRIRPILMTSLTTVLALFPLILGFGENVALRSSMALAVIGGLTTSTLLTLVVIPCFYDILDSMKERITGRKELQTETQS